MKSLNAQQRAAVTWKDGPLLVLAGAGSGKTRVITRKIAHLIEDCGVDPRHITAVTFTNKAAREMRDRVKPGGTGKRQGRGPHISTFHALGMRILKREAAVLGYRPKFSVFDGGDSVQMLNELVRKSGLALDVDALRWQISAWKNDLLGPEQALEQAADDLQVAQAAVYVDYQRTLPVYNAFDIDDLIYQPVRLLEQHAEIRDAWQARTRYLLVDEYQDTNETQYRLVQLLVGPEGNFTVVGDDDQSIYAWRGARPENLLRLREDYPQLKLIKLEQNYRSTGCILECANHLVDHNPRKLKKRLWSELGFGDPVTILSCRNAEHEGERVVSDLLHHHFTHGTPFGDYAILYRGNHQSQMFEKVLRAHRIPYRLSGGMSFFEYGEVRDLIAYLRLLVNPDDDRAFLRIVNTPRREIGTTTLEHLAQRAQQEQCSLLVAAAGAGDDLRFTARARRALVEFTTWVSEAGERGEREDAVAVIRQMVSDIDYRGWITAQARDPEEGERRLQRVEDLLDWITRLAEKAEDHATLSDLVSRLALMDILERDDDNAASDRVCLSTLHAAKGLEFPHVYIVGMEEGLLPHHACQDEDSLQEERRLAYVGITRARKTLTLSCAARRKRAGEWQVCESSRFISELPDQHVRWEGREQDADDSVRQSRGKAHLNNLRGILS